MTRSRDDFEFCSKWAVSIDEMMRHLNEWQPTIIHFSGHGGNSPSIGSYFHKYDQHYQLQRDVDTDEEVGIYLQGERQLQHVSGRALTQMIASAAPSAQLVVLNACFSDAMAELLRHSIDCVVGMKGAIGDDAARSFSVGFYRALGNRRSVGNAVAQAVAILAAKQFSEEHLPICRTRDGLSAHQIFLPGLDSSCCDRVSRRRGRAVARAHHG